MRDIINASLQTGNPVINSILHTPPTRQQLNAYPFLAKINASAQLLGDVVAEALMSSAGARSLGTKPTLVRALTPHTLCELLVGNSISLATLVNIYCAYRRAIVLHAHFEQLSLSAIAGNLTMLTSFINFLVLLFGTLGFQARNLTDIVSKAQGLSERVGPDCVANVLTANIVPVLEDTLYAFYRSIRVWVAVQDRQVPQPHAAALTGRLDEATDAAAELQAQDLRAYGFNPPVTTSFTAHVAPTPQSAQVSPTVANVAPAPQGVQVPQNAAKGAKSKTPKRRSVSFTEPVAPSKKLAGALAPGSDIKSPAMHLCQEGRFAKWGRY
jgi:hypothetical protein